MVSLGDNDLVPLHLVFTPLDADRIVDLEDLQLDDREDLFASITAELSERGLKRYATYIRCGPGIAFEVHLVARLEDPCPGVPVAEPAERLELDLMLELAQAVQCPLCGTPVRQWRIDKGVVRHDPGE